jgi:hypothetical protein
LRQEKRNLRKTLLVSAAIVLFSVISFFFNDKVPFDLETLAFQLTMPGLEEELLFRGVLLGLLIPDLKDKLGTPKINIGNPSILIVALLFGLVHGLQLSEHYKFSFDYGYFLESFILGYLWGWITVRSNSLVLPVVTHGLFNFFVTLFAMVK